MNNKAMLPPSPGSLIRQALQALPTGTSVSVSVPVAFDKNLSVSVGLTPNPFAPAPAPAPATPYRQVPATQELEVPQSYWYQQPAAE